MHMRRIRDTAESPRNAKGSVNELLDAGQPLG